MSWHFSQALEAAFSEASSLDGERSVQLKSTGTDGIAFLPARATEALSHSRYGMTYAPSTDCHGGDALTWCLEAIPVRRIQPRLEAATRLMILWPEMRRVVAEVAARYVFAENVSRQSIDAAADDLQSLGYQTRCISISAADLGADHVRQRHWLRAYADDEGELHGDVNAEVAELSRICPGIWASEPASSRVADGVAERMERYIATGEGQLPIVAAAAWRLLRAAHGSTAPLWVHGVSANYLPNDLRVGAGLTNHTGRLMGMNDDGKSFAQIADYIEANIPVDNEFNPDPAKSVDGSIDPYLS